MIAPYALRLVCLSLACFFLVHLAAGLAAACISRAAIRFAERMKARQAARLLLSLRLAPAVLGLLVVAGLCVPSYLQLEPEIAAEPIGVACLAAALLGVTVWACSITRALRAAILSVSHIRQWRRTGSKTHIADEAAPVWVVEGTRPLVALAGIMRPRLVISRRVVQALSQAQVSAVLRHERAHANSRDNLKRLAILVAPDPLPFTRRLRVVERGWAQFTEWAADDQAVAGDPRRSLSLAAALVRVARMSAGAHSSCLVSSLLDESGGSLEARVNRLLSPAAPGESFERGWVAMLAGTTFVLVGLVAGVAMRPEVLTSVHRMLEHLVH